ncbi:hypothetical protein [Thermovibrio sp.]
MEVRKIEGIIPVEAVSRDLPLKLESFSYYDMKKLLSTITKGSFKKDKGEEFEGLLLKATVLGTLPDGRLRLKLGDALITARPEVEREFREGEEITLRLKSISPSLELSLVEGVPLNFSNLLPKLFNFSLNLDFLLRGSLAEKLLRLLRESSPELYEEISSFVKEGRAVPSRELLFLLLFTLKPEVYGEVKGELPKGVNREKLKEAVEFLVGALLLFNALKVLLLPVSLKGFKGRVLFGSLDGISAALLEGETPLGSFASLVRVLKSSVSVKLSGKGPLLKGLDPCSLKELLKEEGLNPISVELVPFSEVEKFKGKLLKRGLINFSA